MNATRKEIKVGQRIRFGTSRVMTVTAVAAWGNGLVTQRLTLTGKRGGVATAFVFQDGRIRLL